MSGMTEFDEADITRFPEDDDPESLAGQGPPDPWGDFDLAWVVDGDGSDA